MMHVQPTGQACGAVVTGVDLAGIDAAGAPSREQVAAIRAAWLEHHVLVFPDQALGDDDLERFTLAMGGFGEDPFIAPIPGRQHIIAVARAPDETAPVFAENWHTDWSFQARPPAGTCLYGITIPPTGGDTLFANQHLALNTMPAALRARIKGLTAIHSAQKAYAPDGFYGAGDPKGLGGRSMDIRPSETARAAQAHPFIRNHPETGREGLFGCLSYIIGFEGMAEAEALPLLAELYHWQGQEQFHYRHRWAPNMLVMWDNRSVLHAATGGYQGHARLLHRTTIAAAAQ
jgi:taurine dioxygenase